MKSYHEMTQDELNTVLIHVVHNGHQGYLDKIRLLLECGADVTYEDDFCIRIASTAGWTDVVRLLLEHGSNVNGQSGAVAIRRASNNGYKDVIRLLLKHMYLQEQRFMNEIRNR